MYGYYPVIAACVGEGRTPSRGEVRRVASRMRREIYANQVLDPTQRHFLLLAALAALGQGTRQESMRR